MNSRTKKITVIAALSALAYVVMLVCRIPIVLFLKYDPKDIIITLGGFIWGPAVAIISTVIVSLLECFTVSSTGIIGAIMNIISTLSFAYTACYIYKKKHTIKGAIIGLISGVITMTAVMILWNYLLTPLYMGTPRSEVVKLLLPAFLPFNLLKGGLNAAFTFILYKPIVTALRRSGLVNESTSGRKADMHIGLMAISVVIIMTCLLVILIMKGVL